MGFWLIRAFLCVNAGEEDNYKEDLTFPGVATSFLIHGIRIHGTGTKA